MLGDFFMPEINGKPPISPIPSSSSEAALLAASPPASQKVVYHRTHTLSPSNLTEQQREAAMKNTCCKLFLTTTAILSFFVFCASVGTATLTDDRDTREFSVSSAVVFGTVSFISFFIRCMTYCCSNKPPSALEPSHSEAASDKISSA